MRRHGGILSPVDYGPEDKKMIAAGMGLCVGTGGLAYRQVPLMRMSIQD
jgi:hypothetical protein